MRVGAGITGSAGEQRDCSFVRPEHERRVRRRLGQRLGILDHRLGPGLWDQPAVGGLEERQRGAEQRLDHDTCHTRTAR